MSWKSHCNAHASSIYRRNQCCMFSVVSRGYDYVMLCFSQWLLIWLLGIPRHAWQSQLRFVLSPLLLHPRLLETFQADIPLFTLTSPAKHSPNQGWESAHRLHLSPWVVSFTPLYSYCTPTVHGAALGRRELDFTSHPNDDREPWERFSESRPNSLAGVVFRNRVLNSCHPPKYWPCWMTA